MALSLKVSALLNYHSNIFFEKGVSKIRGGLDLCQLKRKFT